MSKRRGGRSEPSTVIASGEAPPATSLAVVVIEASGATTAHSIPPGVRTLSIGRGEKADLRVDDPLLSRVHLTLDLSAGAVRVRDPGSANGTTVRGLRLARDEEQPIALGELVAAGGTSLMVIARAAATLAPSGGAARSGVVVVDPAMTRLHELLAQIASSEINVLLLGETGTGKEVLVEELHRLSRRKAGPLLKLNCGGFAESLLDSELFGHVRGAFTGAVGDKPGLLEAAKGGTVFLDEIGEMPLPIQTKLLRVLEERTARRVGGIDARPIDVRFAAATNRDPEVEVARGTFRKDLFYRLNGLTIRIPPLRDRPSEVLALAERFAVEASARNAFPPAVLSEEVRDRLERHAWPGNVRELRNVVEQAVVLARGLRILPEHLPAAFRAMASNDRDTLRGEMRELERTRILAALEACGGNQTRAAARLGISRKVLIARIEEYGVERPRKGR